MCEREREREREGGRARHPNHQRWYAKGKLSRNVCTLHARFFARFGADSRARSALINKISASELRRKFIKGWLVVGWVGLYILTTQDSSFHCLQHKKMPPRPSTPSTRRGLRSPPASRSRRKKGGGGGGGGSWSCSQTTSCHLRLDTTEDFEKNDDSFPMYCSFETKKTTLH